MAINNHIVNTGGHGNNMFSQTFHGLKRTTDGKLYYTLRDKNVGTFSNEHAFNLQRRSIGIQKTKRLSRL